MAEPGRTLSCNEEFARWRAEVPPELVMGPPPAPIHFDAAILPGAPGQEDGSTLYWCDHTVNEWAEWYPSLTIAMLRLAALVEADKEDNMFRDDPAGFTRWAQHFFERTVTGTIASPDGELL